MVAVAITTRLDAVNRMLSAVGQMPVTAITGPIPADATHALAVLNEVDLETQMRGWHFNQELITLTGDGAGKIAVPTSASVAVDQYEHPTLDITIRDDTGVLRFYDLKNHTFVLGVGFSLKVNVVYLFDFEATPEPYRRYVTLRGARIFMDRTGRSGVGHQITQKDETDALRFLKRHESKESVKTIFDGWPAFRVINREYPPSNMA